MTNDEELAVRTTLEDDKSDIEEAVQELASSVNQVCARLRREGGLRYRNIDKRPKSASSVLRKLGENNAGPEGLYDTIGDLIGVRVVVYNLSDAEALRRELASSGTIMKDATDENISYASGYRAIHVNGRIGKFGGEVQILTAVQDAWAVTSRADEYLEEPDDLVSTLFGAQSDILLGVDSVLQVIRDHKERSRKEVATASADASDLEPETPKVEEAAQPTVELSDSGLKEARVALTPEVLYVLEAPVSNARIQDLQRGIEGERESSLIGKIFRAAGRFKRVHDYRTDARFGNRMFAWKGPLVEGSTWAEFFPQDFSRGLEDFLQQQLGGLVTDGAADAPQLDSWDDIAAFINNAGREIRATGGTVDLLIHRGRADEALEREMLRNTSWQETPRVRGVSLQEAGLRVMAGLPVLSIWQADATPSMHVVDLSDFHYQQTNPDAMSNDDLLLKIEEMFADSAVEAVDNAPGLRKSLYRSKHGEDGEFSREEAVVRLQLQVKMHIVEGGLIETGSRALWRSANLRPAGNTG